MSQTKGGRAFQYHSAATHETLQAQVILKAGYNQDVLQGRPDRPPTSLTLQLELKAHQCHSLPNEHSNLELYPVSNWKTVELTSNESDANEIFSRSTIGFHCE